MRANSIAKIIRRRLELQEYACILGQEFHFSINAPLNLRIAADHVDNPDLAQWLRTHAAEEDGHHEWAAQDLADLGAPIPPPAPATLRLLERVRTVAASDRAYRILGIAFLALHAGPGLDPQSILPTEAGSATRFIGGHTQPRTGAICRLDEALACLPPEQQGEVHQLAQEFEQLFTEFLHGAMTNHAAARLAPAQQEPAA